VVTRTFQHRPGKVQTRSVWLTTARGRNGLAGSAPTVTSVIVLLEKPIGGMLADIWNYFQITCWLAEKFGSLRQNRSADQQVKNQNHTGCRRGS
jgi:hypothetical protein